MLLAEAIRGAGAPRDAMVDYLEHEVVGPAGGPDELLVDIPYRRYLMGTLYPRNVTTDEVVEEEEGDLGEGPAAPEVTDDPVSLANGWMPSSLGLTFFLGGEAFDVDVWGARYETVSQGRSRTWRRIVVADETSPQQVRLRVPRSEDLRDSVPVLDGRASLRTHWRRVPGGYLITVTVVNDAVMTGDDRPDPDLCLHQVGILCRVGEGAILEYPSVEVLTSDREDEELRLLHRHAKVYAIGHGCAADWDTSGVGPVTRLRSRYLPRYAVPPVTPRGSGDDVLLLRRLADETVALAELQRELRDFVAHYEGWIEALPDVNSDIPEWLTGARDRLLERLRTAASRMRDGIEVLGEDENVLLAFRLANRAMLMQMRHSERDLGGGRRPRNSRGPVPVDYASLDKAWYPFQLAFILLTLRSVADEEAADRSVVDLLWFPTGGGKTEAYLAVAALQIFLRRLRAGDGGAGTVVMTRYTLRLLTAQQFQRAAVLVCACALIRREHAARMGVSPITIGLWIGGAASPNTFKEARRQYEELIEEEEPVNRFQLEVCPWCGTEIVPETRSDDRDDYGVTSTNDQFRFHCPSSECTFHDRLPIGVVDEALYLEPPTLLIATVDKFARLTWEERGGAFFGGRGTPGPSLIIQDELHLLSGPLGTMVGLYESAVEALISYHGAPPKILASTATIRRAGEQVRGLFGRDVHLFPPSGLDADDSYFARVDRERPGRLYVGLMSQSHTTATTSVHTLAALAQAPLELKLVEPALDAYWTTVVYHNSLRELGRTVTLARDDVPARIGAIASDESHRRSLEGDDVVELTSNVDDASLTGLLARMGKTVQEGAISLLATTNMLSVGVDVPRLGLMAMNGQPKTTSEYIQATSRVGRGAVPGLVVTMYSATKPRDRSHYESFLPYHTSLYRHVEPTSVTPYSLPSRSRALHAVLVILVRHAAGLGANTDADRFRADDPEVERALDLLVQRAHIVDPEEEACTRRQLRRIAVDWEEVIAEAKQEQRPLMYDVSGKNFRSLLRQFGQRRDGWDTLNSMRNVDRECRIHVIGE